MEEEGRLWHDQCLISNKTAESHVDMAHQIRDNERRILEDFVTPIDADSESETEDKLGGDKAEHYGNLGSFNAIDRRPQHKRLRNKNEGYK